MSKITFSILCCCMMLLSFSSCNETSKEGETENPTEAFKENADDEDFKNSHEKPETLNNYQFSGEKIEFSTSDGKTGTGYQIKSNPASADFLFVLHEWYGINDYVKNESERLHGVLEGKVNVILLDLYDGKSTSNPDEASKLMKAATQERCQAIVQGAINYAGENARIGTVGWCFGGGWSLQTALAAKENGIACVIYYGQPEMDAQKLASLNAEVLGIFAAKDQWITPKVEKDFVAVMDALGKPVTTHSFDADHAFANPSGKRYDEEDAQKANALVDAFLSSKFL